LFGFTRALAVGIGSLQIALDLRRTAWLDRIPMKFIAEFIVSIAGFYYSSRIR